MQQSTVQTEKQAVWTSYIYSKKTVPCLYLCVVVPVVLWLCFSVPPMQLPDESRHFVRACQIAQGGWRPEIDTATGRGGGILPQAVAYFVRHWMDTESLRSFEKLPTIHERMAAFQRDSQQQAPLSQKKFVEFPSSGIYSPALYIPQSASIGIARFFSNRVYVWFYSARIGNALCSVLLIFLALCIAPQRQFYLIIPAVLPISLSQVASLSSDAGIIALTILFVALCIRLWTDNHLWVYCGLSACFLLLVLGKPVHLALGLLMLTAHKRLGWHRAWTICLAVMAIASVSYLGWSQLVKPFMGLAGEGHNQNPSAQIHFIGAHPLMFARILLATLSQYGPYFLRGIIGVLGWQILVLPFWSYLAIGLLIATVLLIIFCNLKRLVPSDVALGSLAGIGLILGVLTAGYILWNPPAAPVVSLIQSRYFLPVLPLLAAIAPPIFQLGKLSSMALATAALGCLLLSSYVTIRILNHYYFPQSVLLGKNVYGLFDEESSHTCPATFEKINDSWLERLVTGSTTGFKNFRVLVTAEDGTILSESDPALIGADLPQLSLFGSSRVQWRTHTWYVNRTSWTQLWLIHGKSMCHFGPKLYFKPIVMPDA